MGACRIPVAPFVPEAAVRNPTHHWFEVFTEAGIDLLGWGERDARVSDVTGPPGSAESSRSASGHDISDPEASAILAR